MTTSPHSLQKPERSTPLPTYAYTVLLSTGQVILVKRGECGYWSVDGMTYAAADNRNAEMGVSHAMRECMAAGSLYGWDVQAANDLSLFAGAKSLVELFGQNGTCRDLVERMPKGAVTS